MGTATQKTWLEKQTDLVQAEVLAWDDSGKYTLEQMCAMLKEKHELAVPPSSLHYSLREFAKEIGKREKLAMEIYRKRRKFFEENPDADPRILAEHAITASLLLDPKEKLDPDTLLYLAQGQAHIKLRERELAVKEESNRIKREGLELLKARMEKARAKAAEVIADEKASPAEVRRRVKEIFGIFESAGGGGAAGSVSTKVGGG